MNNTLTREIIRTSIFDVAFTKGQVNNGEDDLLTVRGRNGNEFLRLSIIRDEDGIPRQCYAIVIAVHNIRPNDRRLSHQMVAAGLSTLGTYGALQWISQLACESSLPQHDYGDENKIRDRFALLKVEDSSPEGFSSYSSDSLFPSSLSIELLHLESGDTVYADISIRTKIIQELKRKIFNDH